MTITNITGDNSIIKEAQNASNKTEIASLEEQIELAIIKAEKNNKDPKIQDVIEELKNSKIITNDDQVDKEIGTIKTDAGYEIDGKLEDYVGISAKDIANSDNKGKYYGEAVTGYECKNGEAVPCWRIFYADTENIYLIADEQIDILYIPATQTGNKVHKYDGNGMIALGYASVGYEGSKWVAENSLAKKWLNDFLKEFPDRSRECDQCFGLSDGY